VSGTITLAWNEALLGIFLSGCIYFLFSLTPARRIIIEAIPEDLKYAIAASLGLFLTFLGLKNAGIIVSNPYVLVGMGDIFSAQVLIAFACIFLAIGLMARDVKFATVIAFLSAAVLSVISDHFFGTDLITLPSAIISAPPSIAPTFGAIFDISQLTLPDLADLFFIILIFFIVDFFDGLSTIVGVGRDAGIIQGNDVPNAKSALIADSGGTMIGAILGTTSITCYTESGVASSVGGKTGVAALTVSVLFLASLFFFPIFSIFTTSIVAPAMVIIGIYMIGNLQHINWEVPEFKVPTFFILVFTLLTFSPANGMAMGFISYCFVMVVLRKGREVHPLIYSLGFLFLIYLGIS
jgi:AGZA family xanthine/uracil permease-like MFS transporter